MNDQLLKFIELCLVDGIISDKEREVIFRKSDELGVPKDECEIILEGMISKYGKPSKTENFDLKIEESYLDDSIYKSWFKDWLKSEKEITQNKINLSSYIKNYLIHEIDGSKNKGSYSGDFITEETLRKMCELKYIPDIPQSFWKKGKKGKNGSVESKYKDIITQVLNEEKFICYLSSGLTLNLILKRYDHEHWGNNDLIQMVDYYNGNKNIGDKGWGYYKKSVGIGNIGHPKLINRKSILITNKSIIEFHEGGNYKDFSNEKMKLDDIKISTFLKHQNEYKIPFLQIKDLFKSNGFNMTKFIPKTIVHNNEKFTSIIKKIGVNDFTKRIINVDEKIQEFIHSSFNTNIKQLEGRQFYLYEFDYKEDEYREGYYNYLLKENNSINRLHNLSLDIFKLYIELLNFRDSLLNLYLTRQEVELEGLLLKFENSDIGMSKFERTSLSKLNEISENIIELKEITKIGFSDVSSKLDLVIEELDSLNQSNEKILDSLSFNNFVSVVNLYQSYKINKNTKSLRK